MTCSLLVLGLTGVASNATAQSFAPVKYHAVDNKPASLALGDLNGDGQLDVVTASIETSTVDVYWNQNGALTKAATYSTGAESGPQDLTLGDVNGDGRLDIITANTATHAIGVLLSEPTGGFAGVRSYPLGENSYPQQVALADMNRDGKADIVTFNQRNYFILLAEGGGLFSAPQVYATGVNSRPSRLVVGDVNGDGWSDMVTASNDLNTLQVLLGQPNGFAPATTYSVRGRIGGDGLSLGDVNGDGRMDVVVASYLSSSVRVWLGKAGGGFDTEAEYSAGAGNYPTNLALGDVTGDGRLDIVLANYGSLTVSVLVGQATGFADAVSYVAGAPIEVSLGDMNGDGKMDIVVPNPNQKTLGVLLNTSMPVLTSVQHGLTVQPDIFPNPARRGFTVHMPANMRTGKIELLNAAGQIVSHSTPNSFYPANQVWINTVGLTSGVYTVRLSTLTGIIYRQIVLE
jgi:hypothetical protein